MGDTLGSMGHSTQRNNRKLTAQTLKEIMSVSLNNTLIFLIRIIIKWLSFLFPECMTFETNDLEIIAVAFYLKNMSYTNNTIICLL